MPPNLRVYNLRWNLTIMFLQARRKTATPMDLLLGESGGGDPGAAAAASSSVMPPVPESPETERVMTSSMNGSTSSTSSMKSSMTRSNSTNTRYVLQCISITLAYSKRASCVHVMFLDSSTLLLKIVLLHLLLVLYTSCITLSNKASQLFLKVIQCQISKEELLGFVSVWNMLAFSVVLSLRMVSIGQIRCLWKSPNPTLWSDPRRKLPYLEPRPIRHHRWDEKRHLVWTTHQWRHLQSTVPELRMLWIVRLQGLPLVVKIICK